MSDEVYDPFSTPQQRTVGGSGWGCLKGCLIAVGIISLLALAVVLTILLTWRSWSSSLATQAVEMVIEESDLPAAEKEEIMTEVRRAAKLVKDGDMSMEQMQRLFEGLAESPLFTSFFVTALEEEYLAKSGLSDEEKEDARLTLHRFIRGMIDESIDQATAEEIMAEITETSPSGEVQVKEDLSDEELRSFLAKAKTAADEAGVPEEVPEVDPSDEIRKVIDEAMGE